MEPDSAAARFKERVERAGGRLLEAANLEQAAAEVARVLAGKGGGRVVTPASFAYHPAFINCLGNILEEATSTRQIASAAAGVSEGEFGVCETGSVCFAVNNPLEREVAMLSPVHFALLYTASLVPDLAAAGKRIKFLQLEQGRRYVSFVTGPSRTADIERVLTIGVQGPKELYVVLLEGSREEQASPAPGELKEPKGLKKEQYGA